MIEQDLMLQQLQTMLQAAQAGLICGVLYDILRLLGYKRGKICEFFLDLFFSCFTCGMIFVLIIGVAHTKLRAFLLLAFGAGWILWHTVCRIAVCRIQILRKRYAEKYHQKQSRRKNHNSCESQKKLREK